MKINPINGNLLVTSRGIKQECEGGIIIPKHNLSNSNICTTEDGRTIIKRVGTGLEVDDVRYLIGKDDVLAEIIDGEIYPVQGMVLVRKCLDPEDDSGLIFLDKRKTRFAEILAVGPLSGLQGCIGELGYVNDLETAPEKVEDTQDDWLIPESIIEFVIGD